MQDQQFGGVEVSGHIRVSLLLFVDGHIQGWWGLFNYK
jgi:hypothetical protein